jgi:hypothetical protein
MKGSKQDIKSQCVYFAIKIMVLLGGPFAKKTFFHNEKDSNEILQLVIYYIYSCPSISHMF